MRAAILLFAALAACGVVPEQSRDPSRCVRLFGEFDSFESLSRPDLDTRRGLSAADMRLQQLTNALRQNGCLTMGRDLADLDALTAERAGFRPMDSGAAIRPVAVHVGVVTSMEDDARVRAFFEARGYRATSIGSSRLGRRVYVGPVVSEGALAELVEIARAAGFVAPYPARFFRF
jgi:hypothetical protein